MFGSFFGKEFIVYEIVASCYVVNFCVLPKFLCWKLIPIMVRFRGGAFGRWLGQEEIPN
jgi:hypothetical protein